MDKVPLTSTEALRMFLAALDDDEKKTLKEVDEDQTSLFHHSWGAYLRNNWSMLEKDTPLVNNFKAMGITHPDDMSNILMTSAWRTLNKKPLKVAEQVKSYQDYWQKEIGRPIP